MAQEPKRRHSKARKRTRRAAINLRPKILVICPSCKKETLPHQVCRYCGYYKAKKVEEKSKVEVVKA